MRFALLGDHPDGRAMADALVASGRHERAAHAAAADLEEVLADPAVMAVIVAGGPDAPGSAPPHPAVRAPRPLCLSSRPDPGNRF